jgi:homoserine kinase
MAEPYDVIAVPASTSNLGPGFDALSVALDLHLRVRVLDVRADPGGAIRYDFAGAAPAGENRIDTAYQLACERFGRPVMGLHVAVSSDIPIAAGLGSSAAAAIAGFRLYEAARALPLEADAVLAMATELEGHPDNAAAALYGGITVSCQTGDGRVIARPWQWPSAIRFVIATPDSALETKHARAALPSAIPLTDAIANLQRALLLLRALETGDYGDLREAVKDRWHQPARAALVPGLAEALAIDHPAVLGVCLSGAGPSVLAFAAPGRSEEAAAVLAEVYRRLGIAHTIRNLAVHQPAFHTPAAPAARREKTA